MAEQRLIDANNLGVGKANPGIFVCKEYAHGWNNALQAVVEAAPTIDPETLPVVRQLREELARVTEERDAVAKDIKRIVRRWDNGEDLVQVCADFCANNNGVCVRHAELGRFDECKGFAYRSPQKEG